MERASLTIMQNPGLVELLDIAPGLPTHFIGRLPFPAAIKALLEYPLPDSDLIKKILELQKEGIVTYPFKFSSISDEPKYYIFSSYPGDITDFDVGQIGGSLSMDEETAILKALGECVERFCLRTIPSELEIASYSELVADGNDVIDLGDCVNFTDEFLGNGGRRRYIEKIKEAKIRWVKGTDVKSGNEILIPAQLVYVPNRSDIFQDEPVIRWPISTGAAFGIEDDGIDAIYRGLLECIERDSSMLGYLSKYKAPRVILDTPATKEIVADFARYKLGVHVFDFTTNLGVPSMVAVITDDTGIGPSQTVGAKADLDPEKAVIGAILEAHFSRFGLRFHYLLDGRPTIDSPKDIVDLKTRTLYWYDQSMRKHLDYLFSNDETKSLSGLPNQSKKNFEKDVAHIIGRLSDKGIDIFVVDISTKPVKERGLSVMKVVIPKLHPLYLLESYPHHYSRRLEGYGNIRNSMPHPFP